MNSKNNFFHSPQNISRDSYFVISIVPEKIIFCTHTLDMCRQFIFFICHIFQST